MAHPALYQVWEHTGWEAEWKQDPVQPLVSSCIVVRPLDSIETLTTLDYSLLDVFLPEEWKMLCITSKFPALKTAPDMWRHSNTCWVHFRNNPNICFVSASGSKQCGKSYSKGVNLCTGSGTWRELPEMCQWSNWTWWQLLLFLLCS